MRTRFPKAKGAIFDTVGYAIALCKTVAATVVIALFNLSLDAFRDIGRHKKLGQGYMVSAPAQ
jgi:hypothetical protein